MWEETSRYGPAFWVGLLVGWGAIAFGLLTLVQHAGATDPPNTALLFGLLLFGHDLVVVPLVALVGIVALRRLPRGARGPVTGALIATGVLALFSFPLLGGFGRISANPSLLPRDYDAGVAVVFLAIWAVTAVVLVRARIRTRPDRPA
ncbi:MAG: hypothetical protein WEA10_00860 [Actinomycetota bacterium]